MMDTQAIITAAVKGTGFITLRTETEMPLNKNVEIDGVKVPNPHYGKVTKVTTGLNVMCFQNKNVNGYENVVRKRLIAEGKDPDSFELSERKWGKRVVGTPFVEHNGEMYLEVVIVKTGEVFYGLNGKMIAKSDILGQKKSYKPAQGGLNNKVEVRTFKVSSIVEVTANGSTHKV